MSDPLIYGLVEQFVINYSAIIHLIKRGEFINSLLLARKTSIQSVYK